VSSYGFEFIARCILVEEVTALRGDLQVLGVPVKSPTKWYGDNLGKLQSSNIPEAMLKKTHMNIAYHMCHEQAANDLISIKVCTGVNVADTATKALEESALKHINKVLFARMRIWYETINKT
jgi:hypothetical protein